MTKYVCLLRGINVSGQKKLQMAELRSIIEGLGCDNVQSYVQSGNLVFQSNDSKANLKTEIQNAILENYAYDVEIFIFEQAEWESIVADNPFVGKADVDKKYLHVTLLSQPADENLYAPLAELDFGEDEYQIVGAVIYLYCPNGYGTSKLSNNFWERKLKLKATTRNWNTSIKLVELLE